LGFLVLLLCGLVWGWRWARLQLGPGLLIHVPLLILAANRTSELLTAVLLGVLLLVFTARAWLWSAVVALSVATAAYVACDPGFEGAQVPLRLLTQQIERDEHSSLEGFSGRDEMWAAVWGSFLQSPWIGHGYFVTSERGELYVWHTWANWTAHNMGLQVLASTGLVGGLLFVAGVATPMVRAWRRRHASPYNRRALWMLGFLIFWFFVWGMANESWLGPVEPESIVFFTTLGFAASLSPLPMAASVQPREAFAIA
jgi:O-antigen ligase